MTLPRCHVPKRNSKPSAVVRSHTRNLHYDVITAGASAGGLHALSEMLRPMSEDFPAILVVQHLDPMRKSRLAELLAHKTGKRVKEAEHGEPILSNCVYVGPPDEHLLVGPVPACCCYGTGRDKFHPGKYPRAAHIGAFATVDSILSLRRGVTPCDSAYVHRSVIALAQTVRLPAHSDFRFGR